MLTVRKRMGAYFERASPETGLGLVLKSTFPGGQRAGMRTPGSTEAGLNIGDQGGGELALRARLASDAGDIDALAHLVEHLRNSSRLNEAAELVERALRNGADSPQIHLLIARILYWRAQPAAALQQLQGLPSSLRSSFDVRLFEVTLLSKLGRFEEQARLLKILAREKPRNPRIWMSLGNALKFAGNSKEAIGALRRCLALDPTYGEGWWSLADMKTFRFDQRDITAMRTALQANPAPPHSVAIHFALGKAFEDAGKFEQSFQHYATGNRTRLEMFRPDELDLDQLSETIDDSISTFDRAFFKRFAGAGYPARDPIFVVGLYRSGSTLIEQILASHSQVEGTGELDTMMLLWAELSAAAKANGRTVPQEIAAIAPDRLHDIGRRYIEQARQFRASDRPFFVDKSPANWIYLGLIRLALPNATIVDARRHPMACGFSNFKQHFSHGGSYSYSLPTMGRYYREYLRMMDHFDRVEPGLVCHMVNERLVESPESEIRRLLAAAGLQFEQGCLQFHEDRRTVRTASAEQVRRPMTREGFDQWRNYEQWLGPLKDALGPALETWDRLPSPAG